MSNVFNNYLRKKIRFGVDISWCLDYYDFGMDQCTMDQYCLDQEKEGEKIEGERRKRRTGGGGKDRIGGGGGGVVEAFWWQRRK